MTDDTLRFIKLINKHKPQLIKESTKVERAVRQQIKQTEIVGTQRIYQNENALKAGTTSERGK